MASNLIERFDIVQIVDGASVYVFEQFDNALVHEDIVDPRSGEDGSFTKVGLAGHSFTIVTAGGDADLISLDGINISIVQARSVAPIQLDVMHVCVLGCKAQFCLMDRRKGYKCTTATRL